jgi:hypothetical protein
MVTRSRSSYFVLGIGVVALSFAGTLFLLNRLSDSPNIPASPQPTAKYDASHETTLAELAPLQSPNLQWLGVANLNVHHETDRSVVSSQPVLQLIPTRQDGYHTLAGQIVGLKNNQVYRITAWIKTIGGENVELNMTDQPNRNSSSVIFDLSQYAVLSKPDAAKAGIEQDTDGWLKVWLDLATSDGEFTFALRPANGARDTFSGDGKLGLIFGGIEANPKL